MPSAAARASSATFGQTVTATGDATRLDNFTLYLRHMAGDQSRFAGYLAAWDGVKAVGPVLYSSEEMRTLGSLIEYKKFAFDTGGIDLVSGQQYVFFLSTSNFFDGKADVSSMAIADRYSLDPYLGGQWVFNKNGDNFSALFATNWGAYYVNTMDASFTASFSSPDVTPVPEPSAFLLLGAGLGILGRWKKWRKI